MQELVFLINPHAGKGRSSALLREAERSVLGINLRAIEPSNAEDLTRICSELDPAQTKAAVVLGGDGTQHFAIRGLSASGVPLYPYPAGTANDLASEHGIKHDWSQFQRLIAGGVTQEMDLLSVNDIPFATVAGIGLGSNLTEEYNHLRSRSPAFKKLSHRMSSEMYTLLSVKNIIKNWGQSLQLRIHADCYHEKINTAAMFICNQSSLGGVLRVAPEISNRDKRFSVLILPYSSGFSMLRALTQMRMGILSDSFISFSTDHLEITSLTGEALQVFGDGEPLLKSDYLDFKIFSQKLKIYSEEGNA